MAPLALAAKPLFPFDGHQSLHLGIFTSRTGALGSALSFKDGNWRRRGRNAGWLGWAPTWVAKPCNHHEHCTNAHAQPTIIRRMSPHWVNEPHQELLTALMVVAGSIMPPPQQWHHLWKRSILDSFRWLNYWIICSHIFSVFLACFGALSVSQFHVF